MLLSEVFSYCLCLRLSAYHALSLEAPRNGVYVFLLLQISLEKSFRSKMYLMVIIKSVYKIGMEHCLPLCEYMEACS